MKTTILCLLFMSPSVWALSVDEYQSKLSSLKQAQAQSEQLMRHVAQQSGLTLPRPGTDLPILEPEKKSLFQIHGTLKNRTIPAGKLLYGKLFTRLVVGGSTSPALVLLEDGQGGLSQVRLMGSAHPSGTQGRVDVDLSKLLLRSGESIPIQAVVLDRAGAYGLEAEVFSGKALAVLGAVGSSFIAGAAASQQTQTTNMFGFSQPQPTGRNAIYQGMAQSAADQSKRLLDEANTEKPTLVVESDERLTVLVQEEVKY
jgi:hypothetical protein